MAIEQILILSDRAVKPVCVVMGIVFLAISTYVWLDGGLQRNGAELLILIPFLTALVLLLGSRLLQPSGLRTLVLVWFVAVPALLYLVNSVACRAGWFSSSWCQ